MIRGSVWWAELPEPSQSSPGFRRPVVIVQSDRFIQSRIKTVTVVVITSNLRLGDAPGNVRLPASVTGLPKDSVINVSQLYTIDQSYLMEKITELSSQYLYLLDQGLRLALDL